MKHKALLIFCLGALLGAPWVLSFSPFEWWWLGLAQLGLLGVVGAHPKLHGRWSVSLFGLGFGFAAHALGVSWLYISLHKYGGLPAALAVVSLGFFALYLGLFSALAVASFRELARRCLPEGPHSWSVAHALLWATCWTFFEWLRGTLFTGFAWLSLGDALVDSPWVHALPWSGNHGALWLALVAVGAAWALLKLLLQASKGRGSASPAWTAACALALPLGLLVWMQHHTPPTQATAMWQVVGVQPNVSQSVKFDPAEISGNMRRLFKLGQDAQALLPPQGTLLLPETVSPLVWSDQPKEWSRAFRQLASNRPGDLITGATLQVGEGYYNTATRLTGDESDADLLAPQEFQAKRHLVPFGEFIPTGFHWFVNLLNMPMGEFNRASGAAQPFATQNNAVLSSICYEDTFAGEFAQLVSGATAEPTVLLNLSNLAWFDQSWALDQHAQMGRARSAEHQKPSVRVSNTGLSGVVDHQGRWLQRVPPGQARVWAAEVQGRIGLTPFAKMGENLWFGVWLTVLVVLSCRKRFLKAYNTR